MAIKMNEAEVHALALACNQDVQLFTKTLKRLLREPGEGGALSPNRLALLTTVLGDRGRDWNGLNIRPCGGERVEILCKVAGYGLPPGFRVLPPNWD